MAKTRIIIDGEVLVAPHFSGVGNYTLELTRALDREIDNHKSIKAYIFVYFKQYKKMKSYGFKNIKVIPSPFSQRISNGLKKHDVWLPLDLFFGKGTYIFPNFSSWPLMLSKSIPVIYDISFEKYPQYAEPRNQQFLSRQVHESVNRATSIATISENARQEIAEFYKCPIDMIEVYYPAVDITHYYRRDPVEISSVQKKYGLPSKYLLFVGNIEPRKNLISLLNAYEKLPEALQRNYPLVLVGAKGWQDSEILTTIERLQSKNLSVVFPSKYVDYEDLPAVYSGADVFVYPSIYEGFGIPPVEAMACGTPVVCADNSSLPEAVGDAAILVDANSVANIAQGIERLLSDNLLKRDLVDKGHLQVKKFSWEKSAKKLLDTIRGLSS